MVHAPVIMQRRTTMRLTQKEIERTYIFTIAENSRRRWKRGVKLNYVEAMAVIMDELYERARTGEYSFNQLVEDGSRILTEEDVMEGVSDLIGSIDMDILLPDGNKLLSIQSPIRLERREEAIPVDELLSMQY